MSLPGSVRIAAGLLGAIGAFGCKTVDASFKTVTFEGASRDRVFESCREVVTSRFYGTRIRIDAAAGRIETDPIEATIGGRALREQCYVHVSQPDGALVEVALMALMHEMKVDLGGGDPVQWELVGSDVTVEGLLLDEISGRVLAQEPEASVIATTVPRLDRAP